MIGLDSMPNVNLNLDKKRFLRAVEGMDEQTLVEWAERFAAHEGAGE